MLTQVKPLIAQCRHFQQAKARTIVVPRASQQAPDKAKVEKFRGMLQKANLSEKGAKQLVEIWGEVWCTTIYTAPCTQHHIQSTCMLTPNNTHTPYTQQTGSSFDIDTFRKLLVRRSALAVGGGM